MNKKELAEYRCILKEIEYLENAVAESKTSDTVAGSSSEYPYIRRKFTVSGIMPNEKNDKLLKEIRALKQRKKKIEAFVENIPDSFTRRIFVLKYLSEEKYTLWDIADIVGGNNTAEGIRKRVYRYLKQNGSGKAKK